MHKHQQVQAWLNWIEHLTSDQRVVGSSPTACVDKKTNFNKEFVKIGLFRFDVMARGW